MLKGVLFVIAIIITFEIGTAMVDYYHEEQADEVVEEAVEQEKNATEAGARGEATEASKSQLNLDLPEDVGLDQEFDEKQGDEASLRKELNFKKGDGSSKPSGLDVKPIVDFNKEERKPDVTGIKLDLKKEF